MTNSDAVVVNIEDGKIRDTKKRHKEKKSRRKNLLTAFSAQEEPAEILPLRLDLTVDNEAKNESEKDDTKPVSEQPEKKNDSSVAVPQTEEPVLPDGPSPAPVPITEPKETVEPLRAEKPKDISAKSSTAQTMPVSGMSSDASIPAEGNRDAASGIVFEIAEELYMREKTLSELEAMCSPPFHKVFSKSEKGELDSSARMRSKSIARSISRASQGEPVFLPEDGYTSMDRPISTVQAFFAQFIMFVPVVNIIAALMFAFSRRSNYNFRAIGRGFLIWSVIIMTAALGFFAFHYFTSPDVVARATGVFQAFYT